MKIDWIDKLGKKVMRIIGDVTTLKTNVVSNHKVIIVNGSVIECSEVQDCISIEVQGNVGRIDTLGSVSVTGNVDGDINTQGSVTVGGSCESINTQGSVKCGDVNGDIHTMGSVNCGNVSGDIDTMGRVSIRK